MSNIKKVKFANVADFVSGQSPESKYYSTDSTLTPFMQGNRTFGRIFPIIDTYTSKVTKIAKEGDILISVRAPVGDLNLCNREICIGRGLGAIRGTEIKSRDLYFVLKNSINNLIKKGSGSTFSAITKNDIENMELLIPQNGLEDIGNILWKIENKILINEKINDNLEKQLSAYYKYYFIQNNDSNITKSLLEIANLYQPETISTKQLNDKFPYFVFGANGIIGKYDKYNHEEHEITVACRGTCGKVCMSLPKSWITGNAMVIKPKVDFQYKEFLFQTLKTKSPSYLMSGSVQGQLTRENLSLYNVQIQDIKKLDKFENMASYIRNKIISNTLEINELIRLRDFLLPLLMNGQATIE